MYKRFKQKIDSGFLRLRFNADVLYKHLKNCSLSWSWRECSEWRNHWPAVKFL